MKCKHIIVMSALAAALVAPLTSEARPRFMEDTVARTLWGEARGEGEEGMRAVGTVIWNRTAFGRKGRSVGEAELAGVCTAPRQFSCWNGGTVPSGFGEQWRIARQIQNEMIVNKFAPMGTWTHYYNPNVATPHWSRSLHNVYTIGNHRFGNLEGEYEDY